jgi:hypothetical protein
MKRIALLSLCLLLIFTSKAQKYSLSRSEIIQKLSLIEGKKASPTQVMLSLPNPVTKTMEEISFEDFTPMHESLKAKYPSIRTYRSTGKATDYLIQRNGNNLDITAKSSHNTYYLEAEANSLYTWNQHTDQHADFTCESDNLETLERSSLMKNLRKQSTTNNGATLTRYRLAVACTAELTTAFGGTVADGLARINSIVSTINTIYQRDLAINFQLVANNDLLVFTNTATDPFTDFDVDPDNSILAFNTLSGQGIMPVGSYDLAFTLHYNGTLPVPASGGASASGIAYLNSSCSSSTKAGNWTSFSFTQSFSAASVNSFVASIVRHEIGHQFGASHTFSGTGANCVASQRGTPIEPGSGNTIMSYRSICDAQHNITGTNDYFHLLSLEQILNHVQNTTCETNTPTGNAVPVMGAFTNFSIPKSTPFTLIGTATDSNNPTLSYTWEQIDVAVANDYGAIGNTLGVGNYSAVNSTTAPLFKSITGTTGTRTFPALTYILNNANVPPDTHGEALPAIGRTLNFALIAKDNVATGGAYNYQEVAITVSNTAGPLSVKYPNTNVEWAKNTGFLFTWNVNNTNSLSANVDIELSTDGGATFPIVLASNTPNDGSQILTIPNTTTNTTTARIRVRSKNSTNGFFFDISDTNFKIVDACTGNELTTTQTGNSNNTSSFYCNKLPGTMDRVTIAVGHVLTLSTDLTVLKLTNNGQLNLNGKILTVTEP